MKRFAILGIIVLVGLVISPAAVIGGPAGPPGGLEVVVINPEPLPVTGTVNANVTGAVDATLTGGVDVNNTPDVNVVNTPGDPVPVTLPNVSSVYRFVGYSVGRTTGGIGLEDMYNFCISNFGELARMCTLEEFFRSWNLTQPDPDGAWVMPDFDFYKSGRQPDCGLWTSSTGFGQIVGFTGPTPALGDCSFAKQETCCAPVE
jgi:hypothetical protein